MTGSAGSVGVVRLGTRSSRLARWQSERVAALLRACGADCMLVPIETRGDDIPDRPLPEIGGEGLFTQRIEQALRDGVVDIAVHSLKDLPVEDPDELCVGAVLGREEVREVLVSGGGRGLSDLPAGSVVGSSSTRRQAQLMALRPDLVVKPIRGNVETRIRKVESGGYDATLLAAAGVCRLGLQRCISEWLPVSDFLPAPGQGAIAVQCRSGHAAVRALLAEIDEPRLHAETDAERGFLRALGGGCSAPVGALAVHEGSRISLRGRVASPDGRRVVNVEGMGEDPAALARALARQALAGGAREIMATAGRVPAPGRAPQGAAALDPLAGLRVVVTRPRAQAEEVCRVLREAGAVPLAVPVISVTPIEPTQGLDEAIDRLESYDWLVAASANSAKLFLDRLAAVRPGFDWSGAAPRVAAVGPGTAAALELQGIHADFVPAAHTGAAVAEELARGQALAGRRVLLPRALEGREEAAAILRSHGAAVDDVPVYRTEAAEPTDAEVSLLERGADAVLFMSGSAVRAWLDLSRARPVLQESLRGAVVACIGPSTSAEARQRGMRVDVEAEVHSVDGLLDALRRHFSKGRTR